MSALGDPESRRVTRSQSRTAPSRETSVDPTSEPGAPAATGPQTRGSSSQPRNPPSRRSQRNAAREAAEVDEPELNPRSKKIGNKSNVAYGNKGKRANPEQMSAANAAENSSSQLQGSIGNPSHLPTGGEAGRLPKVTEEGESILPSVENESETAAGSQSQASAHSGTSSHKSASHTSREGPANPNRGLPGADNGEGPSHSDVQGQGATNGDTQTPQNSGGSVDASAVSPGVSPSAHGTAAHESSFLQSCRTYLLPGGPRRASSRAATPDEEMRQRVADHSNVLNLLFPLVVFMFLVVMIMILVFNVLDPIVVRARVRVQNEARLNRLEQLAHQFSASSATPAVPTAVLTAVPMKTRQINWFAPANGAVVDPYLSSPVDLYCRKVVEDTWYTWLRGITGKCEPASYPPGQALRPWSEPDERWCAPPGRGKLQLTVLTSRPVAPTDLILEHMPKDASLFIGDAPKELELWVDIPDDEVNARVRDAVNRMFPKILFPSSPQVDRELDEKQALPDTFIPVGRWIYNIYEDQHVQTFHIPIPLRDFGVKATRFAVRVNSNWGDYGATCMYRAILHGQDISGIVEDLEEDPREEA